MAHTQPMPGYTPAQWVRSQMGRVRGATEMNSLAKWALKGPPWRNIGEDYRRLAQAGVISDNCGWIFDVAEGDCRRAIVFLEWEWLIDVLSPAE